MPFLRINGVRCRAGGGALLHTPDDVTVPSAATVGVVYIESDVYYQELSLGTAPEGWEWRFRVRNQPVAPITDGVAMLGAVGIVREDGLAYLVDVDGRPSASVRVPLIWPDGSALVAPVVIGGVADVEGEVGDSITVATRTAFEGESITYTAAFSDGAFTSGWSINATTGVVTVSTATTANKVVVVTASNNAGSVSVSFGVEITAAPLAFSALPTFTGADTNTGTVWTIAAGTTTGGVAPRTVDYLFLRDGAEITAYGSTLTYTIQASDVGTTISARARITDAAGAQAAFLATGSAVVPLATTAPTVTGTVADVSVVAQTGTGTVATAAAFSGSGLTFTLGAITGWSINSGTGVVTYPRATAFAQTTATVTATNTAGSASLQFRVTVIAAMAPNPLPNFSPAVPPGTEIGSVWNVGGAIWAGGVGPFTLERRFLRDSVAFTNYDAAASSYTIATADLGKTITAQVRRSDSGTPQQVVEVMATGSAVIPAAPTADDTFVATGPELLAAINSLKTQTGAKRIVITGENLAGITLPQTIKAGLPLTITTATRVSTNANNPTFRNGNQILAQNGLRNVIFDGLSFLNTTNDGLGFPGDPGPPVFGQDFIDVTFRNCRVDRYYRGINITRSTNLKYEWCDFLRTGMDDLRHFDRHNGLRVLNCFFGPPAADPVRAPQNDPSRHVDAMPIQVSSPNQRGSNDVLVQGNTFLGYDGYRQSIFIANAEVSTLAQYNDVNKRHNNVTISFNYITSRFVNTIFCRAVNNVLIEENVIHLLAGDGPSTTNTPGIIMAGFGSGIIRNNVTPRLAASTTVAGSNLNQFTRTNNTITSDDSVWAPNLTEPRPCGVYGYE